MTEIYIAEPFTHREVSMSMQIASLGNGLAAPVPHDKTGSHQTDPGPVVLKQKEPLPGEPTAAKPTVPLPTAAMPATFMPQAKIPGTAEQKDYSIPGSDKSKAPDLQKTVSDLEQISLAFNRRMKFVIDQESREILIKVIDNETDKVIKVLPPQELQKLHSRIRETMGFLFDAMV